MVHQLASRLTVCFLVVAFAGCGGEAGPKLVPVKGTVKFKGAPLADADVTFMSDSGQLAIGRTDAQGQYTLSSAGRPGAPTGPYKVGIAKYENKTMTGTTGAKPEDMAKMMSMKTKSIPTVKSELPEKYSAPPTSGLSATVTGDAAKNNFDFDLTE